MNDQHRKLLGRHRCAMVRDLEVEKICDRLIEKEIINSEDFELIKSHRTREERAQALYDIIPRRGENAFRAFKDALAEHPCYKTLYNLLDDDERDMRSRSASSRTEKCSTFENYQQGVTERGVGPRSAAEPYGTDGTKCQTQHHISPNQTCPKTSHTGTKDMLLSSINGHNASSGPKAISYIPIPTYPGSSAAQDSYANGSLLIKPQQQQILPLVDQNQTCFMTSHTGTTDTPLISNPAEEVIISSGPKAMSYISVDSCGGSYANGCFPTKLQVHQTLPLEGSQDSPLDVSCKSNEQENENGSPQSKQCQTVADISLEIGYVGLGKNGSRETAIKFSTHLERLTEEGKFQQFDEFVQAFLISKHSRDPDIKIPVLAEVRLPNDMECS